MFKEDLRQVEKVLSMHKAVDTPGNDNLIYGS